MTLITRSTSLCEIQAGIREAGLHGGFASSVELYVSMYHSRIDLHTIKTLSLGNSHLCKRREGVDDVLSTPCDESTPASYVSYFRVSTAFDCNMLIQR